MIRQSLQDETFDGSIIINCSMFYVIRHSFTYISTSQSRSLRIQSEQLHGANSVPSHSMQAFCGCHANLVEVSWTTEVLQTCLQLGADENNDGCIAAGLNWELCNVQHRYRDWCCLSFDFKGSWQLEWLVGPMLPFKRAIISRQHSSHDPLIHRM